MVKLKSTEHRLRQMAIRRGLKLVKSPRRDSKAADYGAWLILDAETGAIVAGVSGFNAPRLTLDDVERWLNNG